MIIKLFVLAVKEYEAKEITDKVLEIISDLILSKEVITMKPYWKIEGQFEVEVKVVLNEGFMVDKMTEYLERISDKWECFGMPTEEVLSSVTMKDCHLRVDGLYMINIFY